MKNILRSIAIVSMCFLTVACETLPKEKKDPPPETKPAASSTRLESVIDHTKDSVEDIKESAAVIVSEAETTEDAVSSVVEQIPDPIKPTIREAVDSLQDIKVKAKSIEESAIDIEKEVETLNKLHKQVDELEDKIIKLESAVAQAQASALEKLYGYITTFWVIGFILIAGGAAVALFLNKTYGSTLTLVGLLMIGFASASQYYMQEIALVGAIILLIGFLSAIAMVVWSSINSKRNGVAIREIVEMIEILKETMTDSEKERIFGEKGLATNIQSDLTKEIVATIKERNGFKKLQEARQANTTPNP